MTSDSLPDLQRFARDDLRFYAYDPLPCAADEEIARVIDTLIAGDAELRDVAARAIHGAITKTFLTFAERQASLAVRNGQASAALRGLVAAALAWPGSADPTDVLPVLGVLYDAAARSSNGAQAAFAQASQLAPVGFARLFPDFLRRKDLHEVAAVMGYVEGQDANGFRYYRTW